MSSPTDTREGSLEAPTRHALDWQSPSFYQLDDLNQELERVFDICHGCRRCVSLCQAFPTLFDLVDACESMEVDGVAKSDYPRVVEQCYLCDMCYLSKCPYVPPHEWNVDFPHLMLRAKAAYFKRDNATAAQRILSSTDNVGSLASLPLINSVVNFANRNGFFRGILQSVLGVHKDAVVPPYVTPNLRRRQLPSANQAQETQLTKGKVALFASCYINYNQPQIGEDFAAVYKHNNIVVELAPSEVCCGMPKMELGDLQAVADAKQHNIPILADLVDKGYDLMSLVPSCVLMFKQELPLMFPDDEQVIKVQRAFFDPFEYLALRHKEKKLNTDFISGLGDIDYQVACHLRVQKIGLKTRDILNLIPDTKVNVIERCSGHDGTYGVRKNSYEFAVKIARPIVKKIESGNAAYVSSDCPMACSHVAHLAGKSAQSKHPLSLLRLAYGI